MAKFLTRLLKFLLTQIRVLSTYIKGQINHSYYRSKFLRQLGLFLTTLVFVVTNSKLLFATICGIGIMFIVYKWNDFNWQKYWLEYLKLIKGSQKKFILAVSSGGVIAVTTYMIAEIWTEAENRWLASSSIIQGIITLTTLGLLGWHIFHQQLDHNKSEYDKFLQDLSSTSSLKRLISVRYFVSLINNNNLPYAEVEQIEEYFLLMLKIEAEPVVRKALKEYFVCSNNQEYLDSISFYNGNKPLQMPLKKTVLSNIYD